LIVPIVTGALSPNLEQSENGVLKAAHFYLTTESMDDMDELSSNVAMSKINGISVEEIVSPVQRNHHETITYHSHWAHRLTDKEMKAHELVLHKRSLRQAVSRDLERRARRADSSEDPAERRVWDEAVDIYKVEARRRLYDSAPDSKKD
jgi:hypothetical protein